MGALPQSSLTLERGSIPPCSAILWAGVGTHGDGGVEYVRDVLPHFGRDRLTLAEMGVPLSLKSEGLRAAWPLVHFVQAHLVGQVCCFDTPRKAHPAHNRVLVGRGALTEQGL